MTYFVLYFELCVLYCKRNYMRSFLSMQGTFDIQNMFVDAVFEIFENSRWLPFLRFLDHIWRKHERFVRSVARFYILLKLYDCEKEFRW